MKKPPFIDFPINENLQNFPQYIHSFFGHFPWISHCVWSPEFPLPPASCTKVLRSLASPGALPDCQGGMALYRFKHGLDTVKAKKKKTHVWLVDWDDYIPNRWEHQKWQPNHQCWYVVIVLPDLDHRVVSTNLNFRKTCRAILQLKKTPVQLKSVRFTACMISSGGKRWVCIVESWKAFQWVVYHKAAKSSSPGFPMIRDVRDVIPHEPWGNYPIPTGGQKKKGSVTRSN